MQRLTDDILSQEFDCPYLPGKSAQYRYFYADLLSQQSLERFLSSGWRKFGTFYFRPECQDCKKCQPIRVPTGTYKPSKSQRRVLRKADRQGVTFQFRPLHFSEEIYTIYRIHNKRFNMDSSRELFFESFYSQSCPAMQSEYRIGEKLFAVGFLDLSITALSSVYFIFDTEYSSLSPGSLSIITEIREAEQRALPYYYLGYYIQENHSMNYKDRFQPYELYDWKTEQWNTF